MQLEAILASALLGYEPNSSAICPTKYNGKMELGILRIRQRIFNDSTSLLEVLLSLSMELYDHHVLYYLQGERREQTSSFRPYGENVRLR
jgi:hypothetical protein